MSTSGIRTERVPSEKIGEGCLKRRARTTPPRHPSTTTTTTASSSSSPSSPPAQIPTYYALFPETLPNGPPPHGKFQIDLRALRLVEPAVADLPGQ